jgi:glycerol uptake facilitator-like aquaporin
MEEKKEPNAKLLRSTLRNGITQLLAAVVCTAVLFLFVALTYSRITLPAYTTNYDQKDTQQVVNLLITVVATVIGILLSHCRRYVGRPRILCGLLILIHSQAYERGGDQK